MKEMKRYFVWMLAATVMAVAAFGCEGDPQITGTNAESPILFNNLLAGGIPVFNKNIWPGTLCVGALNTAGGQDGDTYLEIYVNVNGSGDLYIYDQDGATYYDLYTQEENALEALVDHLEFHPNIDESDLTITVEYGDSTPQYPIFKILLSDFMTSTYGAGTIWEMRVHALSGGTYNFRRGTSSNYLRVDRIGYVRQGGTDTDEVELLSSTHNAGTGPDFELTFDREMGALYAFYINTSDPTDSRMALACDMTRPTSTTYEYKFCSEDSLTQDEEYFLVVADGCSLASPANGCAAGMALSQDMSGNRITSTADGWSLGDVGPLVGQSDMGVDAWYYRFTAEN